MLDLRIVIENSAKEPSDQHKTHARMHFPYIHTHNKRNTISNCCNSIEYIYVVHGQKIPLRCCALTIQISSHYRCCKCEQRERKNDKKKAPAVFFHVPLCISSPTIEQIPHLHHTTVTWPIAQCIRCSKHHHTQLVHNLYLTRAQAAAMVAVVVVVVVRCIAVSGFVLYLLVRCLDVLCILHNAEKHYSPSEPNHIRLQPKP